MLKIYHIEGRRSERVAWLMEELGLPYDLIFTPGDLMASGRAIKDVHQIGAAPTVCDDGVWITESGAILEYVIGKYGKGRFSVAADQPGFAEYLQWMHFAEGMAMTRIMGEFMLKLLLEGQPADKSPVAQLYVGSTRRMLDFFESGLDGRTYFAGDEFTAADIMMQLPVSLACRFYKAATYPNAFAWLGRVQSRPAFKAMLARALPNGPPPPIKGERRPAA